jgi:hypothetical protein
MSEFSALAASAAETTAFSRGHGFPESPENRGQAGPPGGLAVAARGAAQPKERAARPRPAQKPVDPAKVLASFNTWAFKREQPADAEVMLRIVSEAVAVGAPISFVLYWGKGPRSTIAQPDIECLDYLASFAQRVTQVYKPGATVELIFTDTHAALNGHSPESMARYFGEIDDAARQRQFASRWLGAVTRAAGEPAELADADIPHDTLMLLSASAKKWYRGDGTWEQGALQYYRMNMIERRAVELAFPRSIFVTFNGSKLRRLFPERLPIFYMYSLRRGFGVKPWFLQADATFSGDAASEHAVAPLHEL